MASSDDPLTLPCGEVLPNRLMKPAMSEAPADPADAPDVRLEPAALTELDARGAITR